ncbi:uncharacterized protein LTR77_008366 [Saxophila tyrrhenica]|uniref:Uncharacterized protein n=1 Tax=Saxophila tyrrhenica TaxID=1690608 RepID=A0AAV9P4F4_9PEZI|nr:hypothetical protein LTR77_008366 [Saxophila tyrrhenica]
MRAHLLALQVALIAFSPFSTNKITFIKLLRITSGLQPLETTPEYITWFQFCFEPLRTASTELLALIDVPKLFDPPEHAVDRGGKGGHSPLRIKLSRLSFNSKTQSSTIEKQQNAVAKAAELVVAIKFGLASLAEVNSSIPSLPSTPVVAKEESLLTSEDSKVCPDDEI